MQQRQYIQQDQEEVEIFFSCRNLKNKDIIGKSDPIIILSQLINDEQWEEIGKTEIIKNNLNPDFITSFKLNFIFETKQVYKIEVIDIDDFQNIKGDFIGFTIFELSDIVSSLQNMKIIQLKDYKNKEAGILLIRLNMQQNMKKFRIVLDFEIKNIP